MRRILLVSGSKNFLERNTCMLQKAGFVVSSAASAMEALQMQRELNPDLVIAMLDLPDMAGDVLCSTIREKESICIPIVLVCYHSPEALARAAACGANAWVLKPVQPQLLLEEIGKVLVYQKPREHRVELRASVKGIYESVSFAGVSHNISVSGILCETDMEFTPDSLIKNMAIAVNASEIVTDGKIVRREATSNGRFTYGVHFMNLPLAARQQIGNFVAASYHAAQRPLAGSLG